MRTELQKTKRRVPACAAGERQALRAVDVGFADLHPQRVAGVVRSVVDDESAQVVDDVDAAHGLTNVAVVDEAAAQDLDSALLQMSGIAGWTHQRSHLRAVSDQAVDQVSAETAGGARHQNGS